MLFRSPVTRELGIYPSSNLPVQYLGRGSDGRTPTYSQTDLFVQHTMKVAGTRSLQFSVNVFNVFNQDTVTSKYSTYQKVNGVVPNDEAAFYTGKETLALAKSDEEFKALAEHSDERVQALVAARLGNKTTLEETRTQRLLGIAKRGPVPVPLSYYAAHTGQIGRAHV